jgi:nitrogen fixation protein NifU and related proteins
MRGLVRELTDLFEAVLLDHARWPRNRRRLENATSVCEGNDPLCGDRCTVYLGVAGGVIKDVSFEGAGCAIMLASASLMTMAMAGKKREQAQVVAEQFHAMLTHDELPDADALGDLAALAGVRDLPSRIKCAMLPWQAIRSALQFEQSRN